MMISVSMLLDYLICIPSDACLAGLLTLLLKGWPDADGEQSGRLAMKRQA